MRLSVSTLKIEGDVFAYAGHDPYVCLDPSFGDVEFE